MVLKDFHLEVQAIMAMVWEVVLQMGPMSGNKNQGSPQGGESGI